MLLQRSLSFALSLSLSLSLSPGSFYNSSTPKVEPFLPPRQSSLRLSPASSKSGGLYFKTSPSPSVRRNLSVDMGQQTADENDTNDFQTNKSYKSVSVCLYVCTVCIVHCMCHDILLYFEGQIPVHVHCIHVNM